MKPLSDITCCVVDHGRFVHVARALGQQFGKVYYTSPEERDCPLVREASVGMGFDEITRVQSLWQWQARESDLFVFPDIGFEEEQDYLRSQGKLVWGCGRAGLLESNKGLFLKELSECGLPVAPHKVIKGMNNLRLHLMETEDVYIKVSKFRGDWETLHWTNYDEMEGTLDSYSVRFGPLKEMVTFYVFDKIDTDIEDGVDAYFVGNRWPENILHGVENKDKSYVGAMQKFADLPEEVSEVNVRFGPILSSYSNGGAMKFSTEVRITKDKQSFFIDPTCRFGSPPSQGECLLIKNLPEIIYRGAQGQLVEPETDDAFVVQAAVTMCDDRTEWRSYKLEPEVDEALKGGFCCRVNGMLCLMPITEYHSSEVGYLCATGDTLKGAIEKLRDLKDKLPDGLKCDFMSLAELLKEIHDAEEKDMEFTDQPVPEPETVLDQT